MLLRGGVQIEPVPLDVPRGRASTLEPLLVAKGQHLGRTLGTELSHGTMSKITDAVLDEVMAWQSRPLEELYPIMYLDGLSADVAGRAGALRPRTGRTATIDDIDWPCRHGNQKRFCQAAAPQG